MEKSYKMQQKVMGSKLFYFKNFYCNLKNSLTSLFMHKVIVMQLKACKWDFTPSSNMSSKFNFVHVIFAYLTFVHLGAIIRVYLYIKNIEYFRNGTINISKDRLLTIKFFSRKPIDLKSYLFYL